MGAGQRLHLGGGAGVGGDAGGEVSDLVERREERVDLALDALTHDRAEEGPHVLLGGVVLLAVAALVGADDDAPVLQGAERHRGVAPGDLEALHHFVGAEWLAADEEQCVDLGHGPADTPGRTHLTPDGDEPVLGFPEGFGAYGFGAGVHD